MNMTESTLCTITNKTKGKLPRLPFASMKDKILGPKYELSVGFLTPAMQKKINMAYRGKDNTTNVLSFPFSKKSGEITFDLALARKEAPDFGMSYTKFVTYLFIHGCLHLKGYDHSSTMDKEEKKYLKIFS